MQSELDDSKSSVIKDPLCREGFFSCPAIISRRPESQNTSKEPQLNPEEESRIIQARSHVTLEKSSKNYKPSEDWAKPNLTPDVTPPPQASALASVLGVFDISHQWVERNAPNSEWR